MENYKLLNNANYGNYYLFDSNIFDINSNYVPSSLKFLKMSVQPLQKTISELFF